MKMNLLAVSLVVLLFSCQKKGVEPSSELAGKTAPTAQFKTTSGDVLCNVYLENQKNGAYIHAYYCCTDEEVIGFKIWYKKNANSYWIGPVSASYNLKQSCYSPSTFHPTMRTAFMPLNFQTGVAYDVALLPATSDPNVSTPNSNNVYYNALVNLCPL